jgi:hypothetical protein
MSTPRAATHPVGGRACHCRRVSTSGALGRQLAQLLYFRDAAVPALTAATSSSARHALEGTRRFVPSAVRGPPTRLAAPHRRPGRCPPQEAGLSYADIDWVLLVGG